MQREIEIEAAQSLEMRTSSSKKAAQPNQARTSSAPSREPIAAQLATARPKLASSCHVVPDTEEKKNDTVFNDDTDCLGWVHLDYD